MTPDEAAVHVCPYCGSQRQIVRGTMPAFTRYRCADCMAEYDRREPEACTYCWFGACEDGQPRTASLNCGCCRNGHRWRGSPVTS